MTAWTSCQYAVVDVEGNGQQPPDLVEFGVVSITGGKIGEPRSWLCKPAAPITPIARRIHGITNDMVASAPNFAEIAADIHGRLDGPVLVAHNAGVDMAVLRRKLPDFAPATVLDTLKLARRLLLGQASYRLGSLVSALKLNHGLPTGLQPHRAGYDVLVTARLFVHLASQGPGAPLSFEELQDRLRTADDTLF